VETSYDLSRYADNCDYDDGVTLLQTFESSYQLHVPTVMMMQLMIIEQEESHNLFLYTYSFFDGCCRRGG
jgi:hypothetical protein